MEQISIFWHRRDLRADDNAGLYYALKQQKNVMPVFIYDTDILDELGDKTDARVSFIHQSVEQLGELYAAQGSGLRTFKGRPAEVFAALARQYKIEAIYCNEDYEPYARKRDQAIAQWCGQNGISFHAYKDQVIFSAREVLKSDGHPYTVFTPYSKVWKAKLNDFFTHSYPTETYYASLIQLNSKPESLSLEALGFEQTSITLPGKNIKATQIREYSLTRDLPYLENGTTRLGIHLRFGTLSVRKLVRHIIPLNETFLNELIWREFFQSILWHFPQVIHQSFKPQYDHIRWRNNEQEFALWCQGNTGFPIVDAGMRELNATGHMHNRVRMIVASFLVKDLLIDWRWGEAYFAEKLLDYELAANNGNWQWAAGCGCDAAPYFRVFNPELQQNKFDPDKQYIKKWVPEYGTGNYTEPMVDHKAAKERCISTYKEALQQAK
ncbi:cryptochrome/photolyase family protein [Edaphocola aurantiacus]|uniref:cryptochrome/photolyase family protein n=1 Tax=Edaphocola aurantiacus TaxID=2601682 RepID=UPI001C98B428|nr:deoxyribodipyrimidine photo-lyase [Edaphocola aurantiacus]